MKKFFYYLIYIMVIVFAIVSIIPFMWMISTSLNHGAAIYQLPLDFFPSPLRFENYIHVYQKTPILTYFFNSVLVSTVITVGTLITTILATYGFSKVKFTGRDFLFVILIATMMVPGEVLIAPNFITLAKLGLINTKISLFIPWIASAFSIFLLRQYFLEIPEELYYAAKIDGCSDFYYLTRIMVPYSKPALLNIAFLRIINSWNEFLWPLLMVNSEEQRTLPVGLATFITEAGSQYQYLMAYTTIILIPVFIIYFILQKHIIEGFSKAGIKG